MTKGNKTFQIICRYLTRGDFESLHKTFLEAFSDYFVPFQMSEEQFANHILQNSVDLERSVGAFAGERIVGFTLNGFGVWNDKKTIYGAGTGVIPRFRKQGIGKAIFDFMTPRFQRDGFEQMLLEVITQNTNAIKLYEKLGFKKMRRLIIFERNAPFEFESRNDFEIREIAAPDWNLFNNFADGQTSWQNSPFSVTKIQAKRLILGVFKEDECIGCGIVSKKLGVISQIAVAKEFRRQKVGSMILGAMQEKLGKNINLRASNVDENIESANLFLKKSGFVENLSQWEMVKIL